VRRDPAERAALQARLAGYEAQVAPLREAREALLAANKQQAGSLTAEAKLAALQERRAKEEERLMLVGAALREQPGCTVLAVEGVVAWCNSSNSVGRCGMLRGVWQRYTARDGTTWQHNRPSLLAAADAWLHVQLHAHLHRLESLVHRSSNRELHFASLPHD
jgi:hypothetical protein